MTKSLKLFFYKGLNKIGYSWQKLKNAHCLNSYKILSAGRYQFASGFIAGKDLKIQSDLTQSKIQIGLSFRARDRFRILMGNNGELRIGNHCFFNNDCSINCLGKIEIGDNCQFGENVLIYDHNHNYNEPGELISKQGYSIGYILIGNNCWIGSNVVILKDVEIGDNVVIGAGCTIYKSVPANTVVYQNQDLKYS